MTLTFDNRTEEIKFWAAFGYADEGMIYCGQCRDIHEDTTYCQRND